MTRTALSHIRILLSDVLDTGYTKNYNLEDYEAAIRDIDEYLATPVSLDYDDRGVYRGGPPLDEKTEYFPLIKEK